MEVGRPQSGTDGNPVYPTTPGAGEDGRVGATPCQPTRTDAAPSETTIRRFQTAYNDHREAIGAGAYPALNVDGDAGPMTWGAIYDCYEHALGEELGEDAAGVAGLRGKLVWVDPEQPWRGYSEHFPVEAIGRDHYRSQENRRVEVLFFDKDEEPDLSLDAEYPEMSEVYVPGMYKREHLEPMASATRPRLFRYGVPVGGEASWSESGVFTIVSEDASQRRDYAMNEGERVGGYRVFSFEDARPAVSYLAYVTDASVRYDLFGPVELRRVQDPQDPTNQLPLPEDTDPPASDPGPEGVSGPAPVFPPALLAEEERNNEPPDPEMVAHAAGPVEDSVV